MTEPAIDFAQLRELERFFKPGFLAWLADNLHIYRAFEQQAQALIAVGRDHYSARTIVEVIRHHSALHEVGGEYKVNDHHAPDLARVFSILHPHQASFWEYRRPDWPLFIEQVNALAGLPA